MTDHDGLKKLREPFPEHQVNKLPKPYNKNAEKGKCRECGGYHGLPAVHLDYVGHAALTDRFLDVDPEWSWEPLAIGTDGLPALDRNGGLWIRLTLCGVTRLGYGDADGKSGGNAIKEAIGDALRNAGMRFGAALELWHKGDLHDAAQAKGQPLSPADEARNELLEVLAAKGVDPKHASEKFRLDFGAELRDATNVDAIKSLVIHFRDLA
ncbi:hypothetical protein [Rhodococcus sp. BE178]|uniref:hypothetical protein n=1 Tax=Rhodococcus sp. BE178 TaxID=2817737 RepID=UPI003D21345D